MAAKATGPNRPASVETSPSQRSSVENAPCAVFAYHEIGCACIEALLAQGAPIVCLFTHEDATDEEIWWRSCADLARRNGIPVYSPEKLDPDWREVVARMSPAVIYSFYYRRLIPEAILRLASRGAYNLHGSLLPAYRGRAVVNWMLVNGEREGGVTLHHMTARADAGDIVAQRRVEISDDDTALTLYRKLVPLGAELVRTFHGLIVSGNAPRIPQNLSAGSYYGRRRPEDGRIDWRWPARRIYNMVRALTHPYPGAFCFLGGRKLLIWQAGVAAKRGSHGEPGSAISIADNGAVEIAAGEGSVTLIRVQFEGASESTAREALTPDSGGALRFDQAGA